MPGIQLAGCQDGRQGVFASRKPGARKRQAEGSGAWSRRPISLKEALSDGHQLSACGPCRLAAESSLPKKGSAAFNFQTIFP